MDTPTNDDTTKVVTDETIEAVLPVVEDLEVEKAPLTETEAEVAVGGDTPVEAVQNLNVEDEEAEKEADPLV